MSVSNILFPFAYSSVNPPGGNYSVNTLSVDFDVTFPANFANSSFHTTSLPAATYMLSITTKDISLDVSLVGTLTVNIDGTYFYNANAWTLHAGNSISIITQFDADENFNNFSGSIVGTVTT